jgi:diadenosine tetraphosphate (Ap4A) HIT family hydrolase
MDFMDKECPFCTSAREEDRILKEGNYAYVIFSNPRLMPGHLLVIPKRHIDGRIEDLSSEERNEIFYFLSEFQAKILDTIASGCDIRQNFKPYVKNSRTHVNHMHWHLQPREFKDVIYEKADVYRDPLYVNLSDEEKDRLFAILKD